MNRRLWIGTGALLLSALVALAQEERSVQSGVYTAEQAQRGTDAFQKTCVNCHEASEFADGSYMDGWSGQMASDLMEQIRSTMPQDNPGSLKRQEYVDIVAYMFALNGLPTGDTEMDGENVKSIRIEGPYHPAGGDR